MITFNEKQTLAITAARIAGLLRALYHETEFVDTPAQTLLETEYFPLYSQLQDLSFNRKGEIKWLLLNAIETSNDKYQDIEFYKTELGIGIQIRGKVRIEVASRQEALRPGKEIFFDFPSEIRAKMAVAA
ncbi:hypothetical protein CENTIMANUS_00182 [Klebsiella phage vB_KpM_Centimanus]